MRACVLAIAAALVGAAPVGAQVALESFFPIVTRRPVIEHEVEMRATHDKRRNARDTAVSLAVAVNDVLIVSDLGYVASLGAHSAISVRSMQASPSAGPWGRPSYRSSRSRWPARWSARAHATPPPAGASRRTSDRV